MRSRGPSGEWRPVSERATEREIESEFAGTEFDGLEAHS